MLIYELALLIERIELIPLKTREKSCQEKYIIFGVPNTALVPSDTQYSHFNFNGTDLDSTKHGAEPGLHVASSGRPLQPTFCEHI